jgi:hypothetical protein
MAKQKINLVDIDKIQIEEYKNYYITIKGKICYKASNGNWMYCKNVPNKPNWVTIFNNGSMVEVSELTIAIKYIDGFKEKKEIKDLAKEQSKLSNKDGRYKAGTDKGAMSHLSIPLPIKPIEDRPKIKTQVISMGERNRQNGLDKLQKKNNNKLYSLVNKNIEIVLDILQKKGYSITK